MTIQNRKFGIEIEAFGCLWSVLSTALETAGLPVVHSEDNTNGWRFHSDGSIHGERPFELVSPILCGEEGIEQVRKVGQVLATLGARINKTCGLHVHVDARDLNLASIINVSQRYGELENIVDKFMPESRRGNNAHYAKSVRGFYDSLLSRVPSWFERNARDFIVDNIGDRYRKVNLNAYIRHGTIEFRQHSGTVATSKMENWIRFVVNFVEQSIITDSQLVRSETTRSVVEYVRELIPASVPSQSPLPVQVEIPSGRGRRAANGQSSTQNLADLYRMFCQTQVGGNHLYTRDIMARFTWTETTVASMVSRLRAEYGCRISNRSSSYSSGTYRRLRGRAVNGPFANMPIAEVCGGPRPRSASPRYRDVPQTQVVRETRVSLPLPNLDWRLGLDSSVVRFYEERAMDFGFDLNT